MKTLRNIVAGTVVVALTGAAGGCEREMKKAKADTLRLESSSPQVSADSGLLSVRMVVYERGDRLHDVPVRLTLTLTDSSGSPVAVTQAPVLTTDFLGEATYSYSDLRTASSGTVLAEALKKDGETPLLDGGVPVAATISVAVLPGTAAVVNATLLPTPAVILPGDPVTVAVTVRDAWDNVTDAPVQIDTDAPGALVIGNVLNGLETAGDYLVVASVLGTALSDTEPLTVGPGTAAIVALTVSQTAIRAGTTVSVAAQVFDAFGNEVPNGQAPATFDVVGLAGETYTADAVIPNAGTFTGVNAAGSYTVRAVLAGVNAPEDVEPLLVSPAQATSITLLTSTASIAPMGSLTATTTVRDAFTNVTTDLVGVTVNAPGASITGSSGTWTISGISLAGSYSVVSSVAGVPISDSELLTVTPGAGATIDLVLDSPIWDAGQTITGLARVYDAQGNEVTPPPTIVATTNIPGASPTATGGAVSVTGVARTGSYTVTATIMGTGISDPESVTIQDVTVPAISFTGLLADQSVGIGLGYALNVSASDSVGVAKIEGYVSGGGELDGFGPIGGVPSFVRFYPNNSINASALPSFTVAGGTPTRTAIQITFQATDMAGNVSNVTRQVFVDPAANLVPSLAAGLVARTVAEDDNTGLTGTIRTDGIDCKVVGLNTIVAVPDRNNSALYAFTVPAVGTFHSFGTGGTFADRVDTGLGGPRGAEYAPNGDLYILEDGSDRLFRYPAGAGPRIQVSAAGQAFNTGRHLETQVQGATTFLFAVEQGVGNGVVRRYNITTPPTASITLGAGDLAFATGNGNSSGNLWGISAGTTNLFLTARGTDRTQRASATAGGAITDYVTTGVFRPQGTAVAPGDLPRFASEVFTASNANGGGFLSPINRVNQTTAVSATTFAHGLEIATDAAFCGANLYLVYDQGPFDARIVEISGF